MFFATVVSSQGPMEYVEEVAEIQQKYDTLFNISEESLVFTGSSSIRLWKNLETMFPEYQIVNSGFGGSETSDLLFYLDELVLRFNPRKVFIYEGDNDIFRGKKPKEAIDDSKKIIQEIKKSNKETQIVLISVKPSIARWNIRGKYKRFNRKLQRLTEKDTSLAYANVWDIMLEKGKIKHDLFVEDGLHMNSKGYQLWYTILKNYIK